MSEKMIQEMCSAMGMSIRPDNPVGCGIYLCGDQKTTRGFFWYLPHEPHFIVTKCDFVFCRDTPLTMQDSSLYVALRMDYARYLPPGKILAFLEEQGDSVSTVMQAGTRVAYTEVMYVPTFYKKHLETAFTATDVKPLEILKRMGGVHSWPSEMMDVLTQIHESRLTGMAAELYYVAKAYELMSALIEMGNGRLPKKSADYADILRILRYIDHNYTEEIRQADLIRLANMSSTKLKNLFRQFTGRTITEYILSKKADHAAHLLADTDMQMDEIGKSLGFGTASGFSTSFKKQIGISPSEYRKQIQFNCFKNPSSAAQLHFGDE
nr:AraC family transcriptional regulator [uncultured Eisenbergiella sp.]